MPYYRCSACDLTVYGERGDARACPECGADDLDPASPVLVTQRRCRELRRDMVRGPQAVGAARRELELLRGVLDRAELDLTVRLVTQLISNSVKRAGAHAGRLLALEVSVTDSLVRGAVTDRANGFVPDRHVSGQPADGDRGLRLVDELADRWGVNTAHGTAVWFELDRVLAEQAGRSAV
jgi:predicted RNA-binding Zn-ribbon protein involved in translation (DUF1610 family)